MKSITVSPKEINLVIAGNLKIYRKRANLLQKEVAAIIDKKFWTYQAYEDARATASIETLLKLKELYKLNSIEDLLTQKA